MNDVVTRFMDYARVWTESDYKGTSTPSAAREFDLAKKLVAEMKAMGLSDVRADEKCYVYASLPATPGCEDLPVIGLIAHMDTSPDMTGKGVKPQIVRCTGGDVVLNAEKNIVMRAADFPELAKLAGKDIVCSDGTTLLGADDKAGIAMILQAAEELIAEGTPHCAVRIAFTPDEEIGLGASGFDVKGFGADFAYTLDGGAVSEYEYETFNAASARVKISGFSIHPGEAKGKMRNAALIAMEFNSLLPPLEVPGETEGYEGFFHLVEMHGRAEDAELTYIIRDHDMKRFRERKEAVLKAAEVVCRRHGANTAAVEMKDQYYNMVEILKDHMEVVDLAEAAMKKAGIAAPEHKPIRGGTDGCMLTYKGLLCPNLPTGGRNAHGRFEYVPAEELRTGVKIAKNIVSAELLRSGYRKGNG